MGTPPDDLAVAKSSAQVIITRAQAHLALLDRELTVLAWTPEYRAIMWEAVTYEATKLMHLAEKAAK